MESTSYKSLYNSVDIDANTINVFTATVDELDSQSLVLLSDYDQITTGSSNKTTINISNTYNRTITVPDTFSDSSFVLTDGNQTINDIKTIAGQLKMNSLTSGKILKLDENNFIVNDNNVYVTDTQLSSTLLNYATLTYLSTNHYTKVQSDSTFLPIVSPTFSGTLSGPIMSLSGTSQYPLTLNNTTGAVGITFNSNATTRNIWLGTGGYFNFDGHVIPSNNGLLDLGATTNRYRLIYSVGLNISGTITTPLTSSDRKSVV